MKRRRVIFSEHFTILISDENFYIAKSKGKGFDKEKEVLKCLSQEYGISESVVDGLICNAYDCDKVEDVKSEWVVSELQGRSFVYGE